MLSCFSHVWLAPTVYTVACQAPPSMGFFRREYWSGPPYTPPGDLPSPGTEPSSLSLLALAGRFFTTSTTWEAHDLTVVLITQLVIKLSHFCFAFFLTVYPTKGLVKMIRKQCEGNATLQLEPFEKLLFCLENIVHPLKCCGN